MEHTPGPWNDNGGQIEGHGGYPNVIATVGKVNEQSNQDTANALLIAAAPDLLEAVTRLFGWHGSQQAEIYRREGRSETWRKSNEVYSMAVDAIARAKGVTA